MLPSLRFGSTRPRPRGTAAAATELHFVAIFALCIFVVLGTSGCASLGRRSKSEAGLQAARELSRQGVAALETGHAQQAEDLLNKALQASPEDASTHRYMAEAYWRRGARQEALSQIAESIRLEPSNAGFCVRAGEMSLASGMYDLALGQAERAIRLDPKHASAWALRGRCFKQMNQPDRALADLQRAVELAPNSSDELLDVAALYRQQGQSARCLTAIYHLLDTYPPGEEPQSVLVMQGLTLMDLGRPREATSALLAAVQHGPPSADVYFYLAQSHLAAGEVAEATAAAQQAIAINGSHAPSRELLAQLASRTAAEPSQRR